MIHCLFHRRVRSMITVALMAAAVMAAGAGTVHSHGGKTHGGDSFTAFQALQKALQLYDRLIVAGKLPEAWETGLSSIHVSVRGAAESRETVVRFKLSGGEPDSVYFFFDRQGEYSGSNFTGE